LEGENRYLKAKLRECQQQLQNLGIAVDNVQLSPKYDSQTPVPETEEKSQQWATHQRGSDVRRQDSAAGLPQEEGSLFHKHITNEAGSLSQSPGFSMFTGTKLSLFGMQIDLAKLTEEESDLESPKTMDGFMKHIFKGTQPPEPASLPATLEEAKTYARWYFDFVNPYIAVLDKRDMWELVSLACTPIYAEIVLTLSFPVNQGVQRPVAWTPSWTFSRGGSVGTHDVCPHQVSVWSTKQ
jgi:hypothetical protein